MAAVRTFINNDSFAKIMDLMNHSYSNFSQKYALMDLIRRVQQDKTFYTDASDIIGNIILYVSPVLLVLGLVGNMFAFIVLYKYSRQYHAYHLLYVLSVMDIILLLSGLFRLWIKEVIGLDLADISPYSCKILVFFGFFSSHCSVWIVSFLSIERALIVSLPLKSMYLINERRSKIVVSILITIFGLLNFHLLFTMGIPGQSCGPLPASENFITNIWPWIDALIYSCLPFLIILISNISTVISLSVARRKRDGMTAFLPKKDAGLLNREYFLTFMLLSLTFSFFVMLLPVNTMIIMVAFWNKVNHSLRETAIFQLAKIIVEMLMYSNHAINFLLYFWTGSEFRQQFVSTFCRRQSKLHIFRKASTFKMSTQISSQDDAKI